MNTPEMIRIRQKFDTSPVPDIPAAVRSEIAAIQVDQIIQPGESVAITAGSRGIANIDVVLQSVVAELKAIGAEPFIIPAMGSHGGGTAEGQRSIIEEYGISEAAMDAPIKSGMAVVQVGATEDGLPVFLDRQASEADHIVVVNRVKPHTDFIGDVESGLIKMMAIGLGKQKGADFYHNAIIHQGYYHVILTVGREMLKNCPIAFAKRRRKACKSAGRR